MDPSPGPPTDPSTGGDAAIAVAVEILPAENTTQRTSSGVTLRGQAALGLRSSLGAAVAESVKTGRLGAESTYRLVPSEAASAGLADGSLRWATASKGDASVIIKDSTTGRFAGRGELQKVKPSPAKVLGPAAWEAMAMATQQHYLVEITDKLSGIGKGVDEVLSRLDDDKRGILKQVRNSTAASRDRVTEGRVPSTSRRLELRDGVRDADRVWHQLNERVERHLDDYRAGTGTAADVEESWGLLLFATQVLGEASAFLSSLPFETVEDLEESASEERDRVMAAVSQVQALASELHTAHLDWAGKTAEFHFRRTRNPAKKAVRTVRKTRALKPAQGPLNDVTAWRASQLAVPPQPPAALLITVRDDDTIEIVPEASHGDLLG